MPTSRAGDSSFWIEEYRALNNSLRLDIDAKDTEILRLRERLSKMEVEIREESIRLGNMLADLSQIKQEHIAHLAEWQEKHHAMLLRAEAAEARASRLEAALINVQTWTNEPDGPCWCGCGNESDEHDGCCLDARAALAEGADK